MRVEARTRLSERFLFRRSPKITVLSTKCLVPLDLARICQFLETVSNRWVLGVVSGDTEKSFGIVFLCISVRTKIASLESSA